MTSHRLQACRLSCLYTCRHFHARASSEAMADLSLRITGIQAVDVRFPTSIELHGSDAMVREVKGERKGFEDRGFKC